MAAPKVIEELIDKFDGDPDFYRSSYFNETEVRTQFINPFFEALGWDIYHKCYPDNRDVKEEDSIEVEGKTKNPDYSFRLFEKRKFFVEVKRPSINIESGVYPAYQIRRYAWSADLPISILTDFEEFSVYYCRSKPSKDDKPTKQRLLYFRYDQYAEKWPEIAALFSREAVLKGSLDNYVGSLPQKRGEKRVDAALLDDISKWREMLAKNIALRNPELDTASLNYSVQAIIDRIMFLRICEDRGIERYMRLKDLLNGERVYPRLFELFRQADERYNSGIFHFKKEPDRLNPDIITPNLNIDDKILKDIIKQLYFPESPYAFSVLPAEILGQIYEQFLGKVIRLTEGHHAVVEDKPEVKKAGGVKYTPVYIVEDIVGNTLGIMLKGKTPIEVVLISVLDPACGSGSFLIVAYQYLLDWHRNWYVQNLVPLLQSGLKPSSPEIRRLLPGAEMGKKGRKKEPELPIYQGRDGEWRLTTAERKRILLNNIYGVDIDRQAVEVTKLSLLLKVLEGENDETISKQLTLFQERALPDLNNNIKCGNSLIGWDILKDYPGLTREEIDRINPFDWEKEFPAIFERGGFDVVIGNPPYIRMEVFKEIKKYLKNNFVSHSERADIYVYFIEKCHKILKEYGRFGMIVSNKFLRSNYGGPIREFIRQNAKVERIVDFAGLPVFQGATVRTIILLTSKEQTMGPILYSPPMSIDTFDSLQRSGLSVEQVIEKATYEVDPVVLSELTWSFAKLEENQLLSKIQARCQPLILYCSGQICRGIVSGLTDAFVIDEEQRDKILKANPDALEIIKPFLKGRDVRRYNIEPKSAYLIYTYHGIDMSKYPSVLEYLRQFRDRLLNRATKQEWYELQQPQYNYLKYFDNPKILFPDIAIKPRFTIDELGYYGANTVYFIPLNDFYLLGLLNSKLGYFYFRIACAGLEGKEETYLRFFGQYLEGFPVHPIDLSDHQDIVYHQRMISLVDQMLSLNKQLQEARTPHEQTSLKRQIEAMDSQIDALVYELYGLTEEEIRIVEGTED